MYTKVAPTARRILVISEKRVLQHNRPKRDTAAHRLFIRRAKTRLPSRMRDCLAVLVVAAHSAPRRPPRCSGHASRRRRTAYHRFGLRDDRAGLPDGRRDVYGEAYEEGECDCRSTDQSETASGHASLPIRISPPKAARVQDPNVDLDQSGGRASEGVDKYASKPQWKTASST